MVCIMQKQDKLSAQQVAQKQLNIKPKILYNRNSMYSHVQGSREWDRPHDMSICTMSIVSGVCKAFRLPTIAPKQQDRACSLATHFCLMTFMKTSLGTSMLPTILIFFLPAFCLLSSFKRRVISPP
eukprot:scpid48022/ scgid29177/ 